MNCSDRPDIVWWDDNLKFLTIFELIIPFQTNIDSALWYKHGKYSDLMQSTIDMGYKFKLVTLEVGSQGLINPSGFAQLKELLQVYRKEFDLLLLKCAQGAIKDPILSGVQEITPLKIFHWIFIVFCIVFCFCFLYFLLLQTFFLFLCGPGDSTICYQTSWPSDPGISTPHCIFLFFVCPFFPCVIQCRERKKR